MGMRLESDPCKLPKFPMSHAHGAAFGALYVLEGSTIGGLIIKKMISEKLGSEEGMSFFEGYGKKTAERWKVFTQYIKPDRYRA